MQEHHFKLQFQNYSADSVPGGEHVLCEPVEFIKGEPPEQHPDCGE